MNRARILLKNLRDKRVEVRLEAARSVDLIPILKEEKSSVFRRNTIEALGLAGKYAMDPLLTIFQDPEYEYYLLEFARAFGRVGNPAHDPLFKMYQAADDEQRYRIAVVLGHMGEKTVIDTLLEALQKSSNWQVRSVAAETFVIIPDPNVIENLIDALNDQNRQVRISAAKALGRLGDPQAIPALEAACRLPENRGNAYSSEYTVEYFASGAIRMINQYTGKKWPNSTI